MKVLALPLRPHPRPCLKVLFLCIVSFASALVAQSSDPKPSDGIVHITLGQSIFPLNGPWKFSIGDSPLDPATHKPLWAEPGFDDSRWENVDLTPPEGSFDPDSGILGYVPGWTSKGHPGYSGYAWYRIRVRVEGLAGASWPWLDRSAWTTASRSSPMAPCWAASATSPRAIPPSTSPSRRSSLSHPPRTVRRPTIPRYSPSGSGWSHPR